MSSNFHPASSDAVYKPTSVTAHLGGWVRTRFRDVMIVAEVLHEVQWAAPWDDREDPLSSSTPSKACDGRC